MPTFFPEYAPVFVFSYYQKVFCFFLTRAMPCPTRFFLFLNPTMPCAHVFISIGS